MLFIVVTFGLDIFNTFASLPSTSTRIKVIFARASSLFESWLAWVLGWLVTVDFQGLIIQPSVGIVRRYSYLRFPRERVHLTEQGMICFASVTERS